MSELNDKAPGYAKGRRKRQEIIETAIIVFSEAGFTSGSMLEIAEKCQLSRAGLHHHFSSKSDLLFAVLEWRDQEDYQRFKDWGSRSGDGLAILQGMVKLAEYNSKIAGLVGLYSVLAAEASNPEHPAHSYFQDRYRRIINGTERALKQLAASGRLRKEYLGQEATLAAELTALMDGMQIQWLLMPGSPPMEQILTNRFQELLSVPLFDN